MPIKDDTGAPQHGPRPLAIRPAPALPIAQLTELIRHRLKDAKQQTTIKQVLAMSKNEGLPIETGYETLRKFISQDGRGLDNVDDLYRLYHFFETTRKGRQLAQPLAGPTNPLDGFIDSLIQPPRHSAGVRIVGSYRVYHTSIFSPRMYAVRAMLVTEPTAGVFAFEEYIGNSRSQPDQISPSRSQDTIEYEHHGTVRFYRGKPHFLSVSQDQSIGFRLIVGDSYESEVQIKPVIFGRMIGMTNSGVSYVRDVLIECYHHDLVMPKDQACLLPYDELTGVHQHWFRELAARRAKERFPDTGLDDVSARFPDDKYWADENNK